jgi:hypothetical protein
MHGHGGRRLVQQRKTILSLCDFSGNWPKHYREAGYNILQVDLKHGDDVRLFRLPTERIHGVLAAPPCTEFAVSGARWWEAKGETPLLAGLALVDACVRLIMALKLRDGLAWWSLENPVGRLNHWLGKPRCYFNPSDFGGYLTPPGDTYTKKTGLWGEFTIPTPRPVDPTEGSKMWALYGGKSERTKELRSMTPMGFARAFFEANP